MPPCWHGSTGAREHGSSRLRADLQHHLDAPGHQVDALLPVVERDPRRQPAGGGCGRPNFAATFADDPQRSTAHNDTTPDRDLELFAADVGTVVEQITRAAGTAGDPSGYARLAVRALPDVLPYDPALPAVFGFAGVNGRGLRDDFGAVVYSTVFNHPMRTALAPLPDLREGWPWLPRRGRCPPGPRSPSPTATRPEPCRSSERTCTVPDMAVRDEALLTAATQVLLRQPTASLADIAAATGISRTTLYSRFPTRQALLVGLAEAAMDLVEKAYVEAHLDDGDVLASLRRVVELMMPLGERVGFLMRERSLDVEPGLTARYAELDRPLVDFVARAQQAGALRGDLPAWWVAAALTSAVLVAWEAIADGWLAPRDAPELVLRTVLDGVRGS